MCHCKYRTAVLGGLIVIAVIAALVIRTEQQQSLTAGQSADPKSSAAGAEIRKLNSDYSSAMMAGDLDAVMAFWSTDADYIDEAGTMTRGSDKIAALFRKSLPEIKGGKVNIRVHSLKFVRPEICLEDGTVEKTTATGTKESSRFAIIWSKNGGKWQISSVRDLPTETTDLPSLASVHLKELEWLLGDWVSDGAKGQVALQIRWGTNKSFLLMDYSVKADGADPLEVAVRVGWDAFNARVRSWMFDSQGGFGEGYWKKDGKRWVVGTSGVLPDGGTGGGTNIYEFVDENTFVWRATDRDVDGQPLADAEVKFVRKTTKK